MSALDDLCGAVPFHEAGDAARAAILRQLADTGLFLALAESPRGDEARLLRLDLGEGAQAALACDDDGRLAQALGRPVAHLALPGREVARMLSGTDAGLALLINPGAPSAMLLDAEALGWLSRALAAAPRPGLARLTGLRAPEPAVAAALAPALARRLAQMGGLVTGAALVAADEGDGRPLHLIVLQGAPPEARGPIAKAVAELVAFMPPLPSAVDVGFDPLPLPPGAVTIALSAPDPEPEPAAPATPAEPRPPRLR